MQPDGKYSSFVKIRSETLFGWGLVTLSCVIPIVVWINLRSLGTINTVPEVLLSIGQIAGLVGLVLYSVNLILTTRLKFLESLFGGLNRVYIAHHIIGGLALFFLAFHPLLIALQYAGSSAYSATLLLLPNNLTPISALTDTNAVQHSAVLYQWALFFGIIAFWGLVVLLTITFFVKLPYKLWLFIHKFLGVAFFFAGLHVLFVGSDLARSPVLKFYLLSFVVAGLVAVTYKTLASNIVIRKYKYSIDSVKTVGGNVCELYLKPLNAKLHHLPGQFVFVRFPTSKAINIEKEWHPFSISSAPSQDNLRLNIKAVGDFTASLTQLTPGQLIEIEGAYGKFSYTKFKNNNQVWIAGGIGITPFLSMAQSLPVKGYNIDMFYCVNSTSELVDWSALTTLSKNSNHFRLHTFVKSRNKSYLSAKAINSTASLAGKEIFICGPPAMMKSLRQQLRNLNIPASKIHTEEFSMS